MPGTLYVVATPIGNLEDISLRALRVLKESDLVCAEDTRVTRKLLTHYGIATPITSYHQHSDALKIDGFAARLASGQNLAMLSDAGTPLVSDPGRDLIVAALAVGAPVTPIPGPSAVTSALMVCHLPSARYAFEGFPPRNKKDRREFFAGLAAHRTAIVLYEAPTRLIPTLRELHETLGDRDIMVGREMTKLFEEFYRGATSTAIDHFTSTRIRGELTIVVGPMAATPAESGADADRALLRDLRASAAARVPARTAVREAAARHGVPHRQAYGLWLDVVADRDTNV